MAWLKQCYNTLDEELDDLDRPDEEPDQANNMMVSPSVCLLMRY